MEEYQLTDNLPTLSGREQTAARLNISLECEDAYIEFVADPNDGSITIASTGMTPDDDLAFDVEDFALVSTLLIRQAQRGL